MSIDSDELKAMIKDPAEHFPNPEDVLNSTNLDEQQKRAVLESWLVDEQELAKATEENMGDSDSNKLDEVTAALDKLS